MARLILASGSRYRRELLSRLGLPFDTIVPSVDETHEPGELPATLAARLSHAKALAVDPTDTIVIGSDQVASVDGRILGKPGTREAAFEQLMACRSREILFHTAVCVSGFDAAKIERHVDLTRVRFRKLDRRQIEAYIDREPALDCAGAFKAEGLGITLFDSIESSDPTALIGLPLIWLAGALRQFGLDPLADAAIDADDQESH